MSAQQDDDERWLRAVAGSPSADMSAASALEARLLREGLLWSREKEAASTPATDEEARDFLLRLQREREHETVKGTAACEGCAARGARWAAWLSNHWVPLAGALASIAALAVVVVPPWSSPTEPVWRQPAASAVQLRVDVDPQRRRDDMARQITALGAEIRSYERLGRFGIDARFAPPLSSATAQALQALGLAADADGVVRIEFETAPR